MTYSALHERIRDALRDYTHVGSDIRQPPTKILIDIDITCMTANLYIWRSKLDDTNGRA